MTLVELKNLITSGIMPTEFLVFVRSDNNFLARQYINEICKLADGGARKINSIYEPHQSSTALLTSTDDCINILTVDVFDERAEDYTQFENTVVLCDSVDRSIASAIDKHIIKFPKLENWQILAYAKSICPHVDEASLLWLIDAANNDMDYISSELDKVRIFSGDEQKVIFAELMSNQQSNFYHADIFTITNALVDGNAQPLLNMLRLDILNNIDPVALANRTLTALKNILLVSQTRSATAETLGISTKYYNKIKYNYRSVNVLAIKNKIKFLAGFDLALKTSKLDMSQRDMLSYLITNLTYKITM